MGEVKEFSEKFLERYLKLVGVKKFKLPVIAIPYSSLLIGMIIGVGIACYLQYNEGFERVKVNLVTNPNQPENYFNLAKVAVENYDYRLAEKLYITGLRKMSGNNKQVLGLASEVWRLIFPEKAVEQEIKFWEQIVEKQPTYRDGWLQLAVLNKQISRNKEALYCFEQARKVDPNSEIVKKVRKFLSD